MVLDPERHFNSPAYMKLIPSINIVCPLNIRRWLFLRKVSLDLGMKFTMRVFLYTSIFLGTYGIMAAFFALTFFKLLPYNVPITMSILGYYDVVFVLGIILQMLSVGAETNSYFQKHTGVLLKLKRHFIEINSRYDSLVTKNQFKSETLKVIIEKLNELSYSEEKRKEHIYSWIEAIDFLIESLDYMHLKIWLFNLHQLRTWCIWKSDYTIWISPLKNWLRVIGFPNTPCA